MRSDTKGVGISALVPFEHYEAMRRIAARNDRTLSGEVRLALRRHIAEYGEAGDAAMVGRQPAPPRVATCKVCGNDWELPPGRRGRLPERCPRCKAAAKSGDRVSGLTPWMVSMQVGRALRPVLGMAPRRPRAKKVAAPRRRRGPEICGCGRDYMTVALGEPCPHPAVARAA